MAAINPDNFKLYQCAIWTEGSSHGGDISATEISASGIQNIFDNVTDQERQNGDTEYRKVYFKNLNADTVSIKNWIETAYSAPNETISISLAVSTSDTQASATGYTYYTPNSISHANVLDLGSLAQNAYKGIWIKRVITAAGYGWKSDTFTLGFGMY